MILVAINIAWDGVGKGGGGGKVPKICNDSINKLMATDYRYPSSSSSSSSSSYPEHKCTNMQMLFPNFSQKILARIVAPTVGQW